MVNSFRWSWECRRHRFAARGTSGIRSLHSIRLLKGDYTERFKHTFATNTLAELLKIARICNTPKSTKGFVAQMCKLVIDYISKIYIVIFENIVNYYQ